ncbi:MAG: demethoxyubiquinone hydroxylase family protein [Alphaproteobacteria bacterium]|nr:demethoxyubiquinone hydroxylase family protein [Alphaproteobacteria bacterium]
MSSSRKATKTKPAKSAARRKRRRLPGDLSPSRTVDRMIRVDHAGEFGAVRIYEGQLLVLGQTKVGPVIRRMAAQEREHLAAFEKLMIERGARPSALLPLWRIAGVALGAGTALLGTEAAMACTVAVEEVIDGHYGRQVEDLGDDEPALSRAFARFRAEEIEHRDTGLEYGAENAPAYRPLTAAIRAGAKLAIWLSERL